MRLIVILLVSFVVNAWADKLTVKCGDEKCEKPSNRAVTTLRYTPDKPYKLQINAVNAEVEIFGVTDDLFYIRHGKNYGFLPKNHLREKARGNFEHTVEVDLSTIRMNQQVREQNFLHEFLKSSQPSGSELNVNETVDRSAVNETVESSQNDQENVTTEVPQSANPLDQVIIPNDEPIEVKPEVTEQVLPSSEEDNDSGIDDDEDDDDDNDDEESGDEPTPISDKPEIVQNVEEQPELIVIPSKGPDTVKEVPSIELPKIDSPEKILAEPVEASSPEKAQQITETLKTDTIPEPEVLDEQPPAFIPMKPEVVAEAENLMQNVSDGVHLDVEKPTENVVSEAENLMQNVSNGVNLDAEKQTENIVSEAVLEIPMAPPTPEKKIVANNAVPESVEQLPIEFENITENVQQMASTPEPFVTDGQIAKENIPEIENIPDIISRDNTTSQEEPYTVEQKLAQEVLNAFEPKPVVEDEKVPITTISSGINVELPTIETPVTTETPEIEIPAPPIQQEQEHPQPKVIPKFQPEQVNFLKTMEKASGNRIDGTGKGTVEHIHHDNHAHVHNDAHEHNGNHDHVHDTKKSEEPIVVEQKKEPGFMGGLFKKFFSDDDDSEQHFHDRAKNDHHDVNNFNPETSPTTDGEFCEKIDSENCPESVKVVKREVKSEQSSDLKTFDDYLKAMLNEAIDMMDLIISMGLTALTVLIFTLGYYCINKARKEGPLIAKINELERHLMAASKENAILKGDVMDTKQKLMSIEDNSFGSNDMVIALKRDLDFSEQAKMELFEKIASLEKELEAAAEDGLELNRMVSELLNSQMGSDSIISSVEDLQHQLNEQQETIITMNEALAAKSRENSELQIQLSEISGKFQGEFTGFQQQLDAIALERSNLQVELENLKSDSDLQVNQLVEERNSEVTRLNSELTSYAGKYDETKKLLNSVESKVQALEECLQAVKMDNKGGEFRDIMDVAELKADLLAVTKEKSTMQEKLQTEMDSRKMLDDRVKTISEEMSSLKKNFGSAEKEKLEAQTRLEVLSTYFKEKEMQLQQDLSVKEARWMKQQGETTTTVEKVQALNDEIQALKSQNDALRVEIEAQVAAHKLNISSLEGQSHAAWLNARQAERKLEESRMESAALRRRLTSIAENPAGASDLLNGMPHIPNESMNSIPSPIRVESPNNSNALPPPPMMMPPFMPQGFMPPGGPPFMPPPPFMPGEMPPLGRLMSPPPKRFTPTMRDNRDRYSPRGRYSPDRYNDYTAFETETDYSPPPSPSPPRRSYNSPSDRSKKSKGGHSSNGSIDSNPTSRRK